VHGITALPDSIEGLTNLQSLSLWDLPWLEALPDSITTLRSLKELNVQWCAQFKAPPDGITALQDLKLTVEGCNRPAVQGGLVLCRPVLVRRGGEWE